MTSKIMTLNEALALYPDEIFVTFGHEDNGADIGIYTSQADANADEDEGTNKRMIDRLVISNA